MDVLIKDMKMPDRCFACPLCDVIDSEVNCVISHGSYKEYREIAEQTAINGRPSDCPLVPVPPHGRLIDADDVFRVLTSYYHHSTDFQHEALKEALARVSTIIPAEESE